MYRDFIWSYGGDGISLIFKATPPGYKRREAHLSIDRASCYLAKDYPEYAMQLLAHGYMVAKSIGDVGKVDQIRKQYQQIKAGPYSKNQAVIEFEEILLKS